MVRAQRLSVDRWLDDLFRTRLTLTNPPSPSIGSIFSFDSDGAPIPAKSSGATYVPCSDDSGAFNSSIRATDRLSQFGSDWAFFCTLDPKAQDVLWMQRRPVTCDSRHEPPEKRRLLPDSDEGCKHDIDFVSVTDVGQRRASCRQCAATLVVELELDDRRRPQVRAVTHVYVCSRCGLPKPMIDCIDGGLAAPDHVRCHRIIVERRQSERRIGDGSELIKNLADGWCRLAIYEPAQPRNEDIAEQLGITTGKLHRLVKVARARIREKLEGSE